MKWTAEKPLPSTALPSTEIGPNGAKVLIRLQSLNKTQDDLVRVAKSFNALDENQTWNDLTEEKLAVFLVPDNWAMLEEALKALGRPITALCPK